MKNTTNPANEKGQEYKLPDGLQDDMLELNKEVKKSKDKKSIFSRTATYLAALSTVLTLTAATPAFSQTPDKKLNSKNITIGVLDSLIIDVNKYYPGEKAYVQELLDKITSPGLRTIINDCLQQTVMNK